MITPRSHLSNATTRDSMLAAVAFVLTASFATLPHPAVASANLHTEAIAGIPVEEARAALAGKNYVLQSDRNGTVESVVVSGDNGSGHEQAFTAVTGRLAQNSVTSDMPARPAVKLNQNLQGQAAVDALGADLPSVAAAHGWSADRLKEILLTDPTAWIDTSGRVYYVEAAQTKPPREQASTATTANAGAAAPMDLGKTFLLHSKPGSSRVIYLDFNGHTVSGTAWNTAYKLPVINAPAFDIGGNPGVFDDTEMARIQSIWQRVSEDYAPFDVDVTTEEPSMAALDRTSAADQVYGTRAVITRSVLNCGCGGVAYVGAFDFASTAYKPAWVFYDALGNGNEKYVAEAISHEVGHNLGLSHDGTSSVGYYQGHGAGTTGWAPIMGVGYYRELTQWSNGEYPGANNKEDDFAILQTHGALVLPDEAGDTTATAALLGGSGTSVFAVTQMGAIQRRADVDYFVFVASAGPVNLTVTPAVAGANLDVNATLYASNGALVASSSPTTSLDASIVANVSAGTYYLKIDGTGKASSGTDFGYSDYGSLGRYQIAGTFSKGAGQAPTAAIATSAVSGLAPLPVGFSSSGSKDDGSIVAYNWNFGDGTAASKEPNPQHTFAAAGTYTVTLTVTDNSGLTGNATARITVTAPAATASLRVGQMAMQLSGTRTSTRAWAYVLVTDGNGKALSGATVQGKWSGLVTATASAVTSASGVATIASPISSATKGTLTFSVTGVIRAGYTYAPAKNAVSSLSISR